MVRKELKSLTEVSDADCAAIGYMNTGDGRIRGDVRWNPHWKKFQVFVDGTKYGEYDNVEDAIQELKDTGFKNLKIKK